jgi:acetoacetyl-CoA reductase
MSRNILVTGGTRGIGGAISVALKSQGNQVLANYHSDHKSAKEFSKVHDIPAFPWDVGNYEACKKNAAYLEKEYGPIDIVIHNAGIIRDSFMHKMDVKDWDHVIATNLSSCFYVVQPFIGGMRERGFGRVVMLSSINGVKGQMGQVNYCAAKAGMIGFVKALAQENAVKGITVNAIAPGYIMTDMVKKIDGVILEKIAAQIPTGNLGDVADVVRGVQFLISEEAKFITGSTLHINGGQYMS